MQRLGALPKDTQRLLLAAAEPSGDPVLLLRAATRLGISSRKLEVFARGEAYALDFANWASAVLYNGLGRPEEARPAAERASEHLGNPVISSWGLVELISAALESGRSELAAEALDRSLGSHASAPPTGR